MYSKPTLHHTSKLKKKYNVGIDIFPAANLGVCASLQYFRSTNCGAARRVTGSLWLTRCPKIMIAHCNEEVNDWQFAEAKYVFSEYEIDFSTHRVKVSYTQYCVDEKHQLGFKPYYSDGNESSQAVQL